MPQGRSRRNLLGGLLAAVAAMLLAAWALLGRARRARLAGRHISLPRPIADGVALEDEVVMVREGGEVRAFSSHCPHLGCRLSRVEAGELVCPCHGSRFDTAGRRVSGPAASGLVPLPLEEKENGRVEVVLPS